MARSRRARQLGIPSRWRRRLFQLALALVVLWGVGRYWDGPGASPRPVPAGFYRVEHVVDGDTLKLADGRSVRVIGVDTPECVRPDYPVEPWGPEASEFTRRFVGSNPVRLEYDGRREDRYGRTLAHVWVGDELLAEALLQAGLAKAETLYRFSAERKARFESAEAEARRARRGIWSK